MVVLFSSLSFLADGLGHRAALEVGHVVRLQVLQVERLAVGQLFKSIIWLTLEYFS